VSQVNTRFLNLAAEVVDGRDKPGHDGVCETALTRAHSPPQIRRNKNVKE
jgi:hypothetical protein